MDFCSSRHIEMLCLEGSGRVSDVWKHVWPERALSEFDPVKAHERITQAFCRTATHEDVTRFRRVLQQVQPDPKQGDVVGAYVKAPLGGRRIYVRLDKKAIPEEWKATFAKP